MVGPTIVSTGDRIDNDNLKKIGVLGAYNLPIVEWTREIYTGSTPKAGFHLAPRAADGGEDYVITGTDKSTTSFAFSEWDPGLVANCDTAYTAGDDIPIIPFFLNEGTICRNIHCANPAANLNPMTSVCTSSGTAGLVKATTEHTPDNTSPYGFHKSCTAVGTNGTHGNYNLNSIRVVGMHPYYLANPAANYQDVVIIRW